MKAEEFSIEAKNFEQIKVTFPSVKREAVEKYMHKNGWWIERIGPVGQGRGTIYFLAKREDTVHDTATLLDEVKYDISKL